MTDQTTLESFQAEPGLSWSHRWPRHVPDLGLLPNDLRHVGGPRWKQSFPWDNYDDEFGTNRECVEAFLKWKNAELPQWREDVDLHGFDEDERTPWIAWDEMKLAEERKWREIESKLLHHIIYFPTQLQLTVR